MTLTLRFYDEAGTELGWVTHDPDDYYVSDEVTNAKFARQSIEATLGYTEERTGGSTWIADGNVYRPVDVDGSTPITDWREVLAEIGSGLWLSHGVDSYEVREE